MSGILSYMLNFVPIPIGILAFHMIKSINISGRKVRIYETMVKGNPSGEIESEPDPSCLMNFESLIKDMLIVNGRFWNNRKVDYPFLGFSVLGIINSSGLELLPGYLRRTKKDRIGLFVSGSMDITSRLLEFGKTSGILIAYSSDYKLDILEG